MIPNRWTNKRPGLFRRGPARSNQTGLEIRRVVCGLLLLAVPAVLLPARVPAAEPSVVDSLGRKIVVPAKVERIGTLYAFTAHVVAMLGKAEKIVAVSNGPKRDILLNRMHPEIQKALVPKYQGAINIEELARARPDIVFVSSETGLDAAEGGKLDSFSIPWVAVDYRTMAQQRAVVAMIGTLINAAAKAEEFNDAYLACLARVENALSAVPEIERVRVYLATHEPTRTALPESLPSDWLRSAGAINVAAAADRDPMAGNTQVSIEQVLMWNPQVILANEPGTAAWIRSSPQWSAVAAVREGKVFQMPIGISRWGHPGSLETPLAVLWTAKTLYPDLFKNVDMRKELKRFYKTFFGYDLSKEMVERVLAGKGMRLTKNRKKLQ